MPRVETDRYGSYTVMAGRWTGDRPGLVAWLNQQDFGPTDVRRALRVAALLDGTAHDFPKHDDVREPRTLGVRRALGGPGSGDLPGHEFHGNQYTGGIGGSAGFDRHDVQRPEHIAREQIAKPSSDYPPSNPHGVDTQNRFSDGRGHYTPERTKLHNAIITHYMEETEAVEQPTSIIFGGGPAAGKSTLAETEQLGRVNTVLIDVDNIRTQLPEYRERLAAKDVAAASYTHEESSDIAKALTRRAIDAKRNVLLDGTGDGRIERLAAKAAVLRMNGHKVIGRYATCPTELALKRAEARGRATGRYVPETFIRETHAAVSRIYPEAVRHGLFDRSELHDTTGQTPILIASSEGTTLTVHDQDRWKAFVAKGEKR
jgi:predicted ABC-type ATPase